ncbi:translation initiation factor eIF-1A [Methanohalophilus portucalensis]|uniref:Translation initiation factor 1A n=2 Tax=Methanohalophilus portucalensis TaxID=39664 RepID=A0A1X7N4Z9_9EURY|nr:translation initiation factor eIF-1A [Methanohalophilus portucalensis]ATU08613.1 translation initiation factor eIF-1A [Methanohalophilus portucalensis]RNI13215.1 translation initiation factor eIF-1A [Methanohalophilus portucalensis FDF-1]SMH32367.1 translation initiation factor 1A (aeIF-1A) [Methanohalophilus portucalensis FDF-1]
MAYNNYNKNKNKNKQQSEGAQFTKVRTPRKDRNEIVATVSRMLGGKRLDLQCMDGVVRMGRIPGSRKRRMRIREGDVVLAVPWDIQDSKADVVWKYRRQEVAWLQKKGYLK